MKKKAEPLPKFIKALSRAERKTYARAVRKELANILVRSQDTGQISKNAVPPLRMVGDVLGIMGGSKDLTGNKGKSAAMTPIQIPPSPPFSAAQWMSAAAMAAWQKFPERAASVGLNPPPYPTASTQIEGQVPPSDPTHQESVVTAQRVLQYLLARFNPIRNLTPQRMAEYLEQWNLGFLRWWAMTWDTISQRDDKIAAVVPKRTFAVSRLKWEIITDDDSPEAQLHKTALEYAYKNLTCTDVIDQNKQGGVSMLIRQQMAAIGFKWQVHEIVWKPSVDDNGVPQLTAHFRAVPLWFFENRTGSLRYLPYELALDGIPLDFGGWLVTSADGLGIATSIAYLYKQLALRSWANFNDKFGMPFLLGKTNAAFGSSEWNQFVQALGSIRGDGSMLVSDGGTVESLKVQQSGELPQEKFCDRMDRAISSLWRGGDLSTMSRGGSGSSGALPQIQSEDEIAEADSILLSESLNFYFDRPLLRYKFGTSTPKARFKIIPPEDIDTAKEIAVDQFLISIGVGIAKADLRSRYGRPAPDEGQELATAPVGLGQDIGKGIGDNGATGALSLGNRQSAPHQIAAWKIEAMRRMSFAQAKALKPLADRIRAASEIDNDEQRQAELANIRNDLPKLFRSVNDHSGDLVKVLEEILGTALVSGAVESAASRQ